MKRPKKSDFQNHQDYRFGDYIVALEKYIEYREQPVSEDNIDDTFGEVALAVESSWGMGGFADTIYEEFARCIYNKLRR